MAFSRRNYCISQKMSYMWRNPFYCGISINRLLDKPIRGNWEPVVSEHDFIKVQQMLEENHAGYQHNRDEANRPLTQLLRCNNCNNYLAGYMVRKKNLHYYEDFKKPCFLKEFFMILKIINI